MAPLPIVHLRVGNLKGSPIWQMVDPPASPPPPLACKAGASRLSYGPPVLSAVALGALPGGGGAVTINHLRELTGYILLSGAGLEFLCPLQFRHRILPETPLGNADFVS